MEDLGRLEQNRRLHQAEQDRLVRLARAAKGKRGLSILPALAWLGLHLIRWGQNLQVRGGLEIGVRTLPVADPCQSC